MNVRQATMSSQHLDDRGCANALLTRRAVGRRAGGFTLMELLVVVAILAIVAGLVTVAYDGLVGQAAKGSSANAISSLNNSITIYQVTERKLPTNLDTLLAVTPNGVVWDSSIGDNLTSAYSGSSEYILSLNPSLKQRLLLEPKALTAFELKNLVDAGITTLRYIDIKGNSLEATAPLSIPTVGSVQATANVGSIALVDIPSHLFDVPLDSGNRGRGFAVNLLGNDFASGANLPHVAVLAPGPGRYEYIKLGVSSETAVLVVFGIGKNSSIVNASNTALGRATNARLSAAPFYGDVAKNEYPNYLALIDVSQSPARFITVIDPTGGFLAENYAAGRGQR